MKDILGTPIAWASYEAVAVASFALDPFHELQVALAITASGRPVSLASALVAKGTSALDVKVEAALRDADKLCPAWITRTEEGLYQARLRHHEGVLTIDAAAIPKGDPLPHIRAIVALESVRRRVLEFLPPQAISAPEILELVRKEILEIAHPTGLSEEESRTHDLRLVTIFVVALSTALSHWLYRAYTGPFYDQSEGIEAVFKGDFHRAITHLNRAIAKQCDDESACVMLRVPLAQAYRGIGDPINELDTLKLVFAHGVPTTMGKVKLRGLWADKISAEYERYQLLREIARR